jgi:hypothetical protein
VLVTYTAGFLVQGEPQTVPGGGGTITVSRMWLSDAGVTYANGTALTFVSGAPAAGQYQLGTLPGQYTFAAADANAGVKVSYGYCPQDVAQACIEFVGSAYKRKGRIDEVSASINGQETVAYMQKDMNATVRTLLTPYCFVSQGPA